jgi:hypothetical protein
MFIYLFIYLFVCLFVSLSVCLFVSLRRCEKFVPVKQIQCFVFNAHSCLRLLCAIPRFLTSLYPPQVHGTGNWYHDYGRIPVGLHKVIACVRGR